jgi:hypothetical protein
MRAIRRKFTSTASPHGRGSNDLLWQKVPVQLRLAAASREEDALLWGG